MKANNANQRIAREIAELQDDGYNARAREIRAENERRTARAAKRFDGGRQVRLMRDVMSTPWAEYRA